MTAELTRRAELADVAGRLAAVATASGGAIALRELPFLAQVGLRVAPGSPAARAVESTLGCALPGANAASEAPGGRALLWLGPDEWLVVGPDGDEDAIVAELRAAAAAGGPDALVAATGLTANRTTLELSGPGAHDVLASVCGLDLHPRAFTAGSCAQTLLASAPVILRELAPDAGASAGSRRFHVLVRPSLAHYVAEWLADAADGVVAAAAARPCR